MNTYDIGSYTDQELYNILDLQDPSDRELEAKLLFFIDKYRHIGEGNATQLVKFFEDIYSHFFEEEEDQEEDEEVQEYQEESEEEEEQEENQLIIKENVTNMGSLQESIPQNAQVTVSRTIEQGQQNQIRREIISRIITIDSTYRENKESLSTNFYFNLSETLKNVISIQLYSIQLPKTWYTISNTVGSNFFVIKGNSPGITGGDHDYKVEINPGNYTASTLVDTVNTSIQNLKNTYTDVSFGNSVITYNPANSITTMNMDVTRRFNETSYIMNFPGGTTYNIADRTTSIPNFMGLEETSFDVFHIDGEQFATNVTSSTDIFQITDNNNYFTIYIYNGIAELSDTEISNNSSRIEHSFSLKLANVLRTTRSLVLTELNTKLQSSNVLSNESICEYNATTNRYRLKIKPNRYDTNINMVPYTKTKVVFSNPSTNPIFVGSNSVFNFSSSSQEMNTIIGKNTTVADSGAIDQVNNFEASRQPTIKLTTDISAYNVPGNEILFILDPSPQYALNSFIANINTKVQANNLIGTNSALSIDTGGIFQVNMDVTKSIPTTELQYDLSGLLGQLFYSNITSYPGLTDISGLNTIDPSLTGLNGSTNYTLSAKIKEERIYNLYENDLLMVLRPKTDSTLISTTTDISYHIRLQEGTYTQINERPYNISRTDLQTSIKKAFDIYQDPYVNEYTHNKNIFTGTTIQVGETINGFIDISFVLQYDRKLTEEEMSIQFLHKAIASKDSNNTISDLSNTVWVNSFNVDPSMVDLSYSFISGKSSFGNSELSTSTQTNGLITSRGIKGTTSCIENTMELNTNNNTIELIPNEVGVTDNTNANKLTITLPIIDSVGLSIKYTITSLVNSINDEFSKQIETNQTLFSTENNKIKIRLSVNKEYKTNNYNIVFFDPLSFSKCGTGVLSSIQSATWDTTLGWMLGYQSQPEYVMNTTNTTIDTDNGKYIAINLTTYNVSLVGNATINTNLYNYLLLSLDDFNQNRMNDGVVTIANKETTTRIPSYANRTNFVCDPITGEARYNAANDQQSKRLTQKQIAAVTAKANSKNQSSIISNTGVSGNSFGTGPFEKDVFSTIPLKIAGLANSESFVEFGGTLQTQSREYFGPVDLERMYVKLKTDRGNLLDLNKSNWSFSIVVKLLNKKAT